MPPCVLAAGLGPHHAFLPPRHQAEFLLTGNFDDDELLDLVVAGTIEGETVLEVFLARETQTFEQRPRMILGDFRLGKFVPVDFDADGDTDLVGLTASDIAIIESIGDGRFAHPRLLSTSSSASDLAVGDVTGDGRPDVVTTDQRDHTMNVQIQLSDGTLGKPRSFLVAGRGPRSVSLSDMDGDGALDGITLDARTRSLSIFTNHGEGVFGEPIPFDLDEGVVTALEVADMDGKGSPEIIVSFVDRVVLYYNPADAGAGPSRPLAVRPVDTAIVDLDADGDLDLIVADGEEEASDIDGLAHGIIVPFTNPGDGALVRNPDIFVDPESVRVEARFVVAGDFDGDGANDVALSAQRPARLEFFLSGLEERVHFEPVLSEVCQSRPHQLAVADFNLDGLPDLVMASSIQREYYSIAYNQGGGRFERVRHIHYSGVTQSVAVGDLDGDADVDIIIGDPGGGGIPGPPAIAVIENLGDEEFARDVKYAIGPHRPHKVDLGDIDGDGDLDALAVSSRGVITLRNDGAGIFSGLVEMPVDIRDYFWGSLADFDGDGHLDYAVTDQTGLLFFVLLNRGDGVFDLHGEYYPLAEPRVVLHFDIDSDGDFDLLLASGEAISVFRNDGKGNFECAGFFDVGRKVYSVTALDYNADGTYDIAATSVTDFAAASVPPDSLSVRLGLGDGDFGAPFHLATELGTQPVLAHDLDLDGDTDIVVGNRRAGTLTAFLNPANDGRPGEDLPGAICDVLFRRGDVQADGEINLLDTLYVLEWLFRNGPAPPCLKAADADDDGRLNIADPVAALVQLFRGAPLPEPFPSCGTGRNSALSCQSFAACED